MKKALEKTREFLARHSRAVMFGALFLAVAVFSIICLSKIGAWSVWFDESFSAFMIRQEWGDIWRFTALDVNAPLYYYLLKIWSFVVGNSEVALRLLSVLFGIGILISGFFLTRRLFGKRVGYFALLFLTLSPMLLRYATEMRCYTMLIFLLIVATYVFVVAQEKRQRKWWLLYGFLIAAAMWTHYYAALPILAHFIWRLVIMKKQFFTRDFVWGLGLAAALFLPWLPTMIKQFTTVQTYGFWIPSFGLDTVGDFLGEMMVYSRHDMITGWVALGLIAALVLSIILLVQGWRTLTKKIRPNFLLLLLLIFLPPVVLAALSMPILRPMFINRYVMFSMVIFSVLIAVVVGMEQKTRTLKVTQAMFLALMLALSGWGAWNVLHYGNYNYDTREVSMAKSLMSEVATKSTEKTIVIAETPWVFYDAVVYETEQNPVYFLDSSTKYEYGSLPMLQADKTHKIVDLTKFVQPGQKVWFVSSSNQLLGIESNDSLPAVVKNWQLLQTFSITDPINGKTNHSAAEYLVK